jgi:preprotein translocase subunit SecG
MHGRESMVGELSGDTADFLNEISWFDGIIYIIILMGLYIFYKWANKKF